MSRTEKAWTVAQLREALEGVDGTLTVVVEVSAEQQGADHVLGGLFAASAETRCDEIEAFYISGDEDYTDQCCSCDYDDLDSAAKAMAEGDTVAMLRVYQSLKEWDT